MPELPDVENYKRYLEATALHKRIKGVHVADTRFLRETSEKSLRDGLVGRAFARARRHGKYLLVQLEGGGWVASHFGMTGNLRYFKDSDQDPEYDRVRLDFDNGDHLAFVSKRMLGHLRLIEDADRFIKKEKLGVDALDPAVDRAWFRQALAAKRGGLKSTLTDQSFIAGIGNVYCDEILFRAKLDPDAKARKLDDDQKDRLFDAMREVLHTAIDCGAGSEELVDRLPDDYLLRYREKGAPCPRCGTEIETRKVSGRTTYICPRCQK